MEPEKISFVCCNLKTPNWEFSLIHSKGEIQNPSDKRSTRRRTLQMTQKSTSKEPAKRPRDPLAGANALSRASERDYHRLDLKVAAFVKMRDSVSFYRKILMSMYLKKQQSGGGVFIFLERWSVRGIFSQPTDNIVARFGRLRLVPFNSYLCIRRREGRNHAIGTS